jgi:putative transposase
MLVFRRISLSWIERLAMTKRFSVDQIVTVLKQAELGLSVAGLMRRVGILEQTFYGWKKQYAGLATEQLRSLRSSRRKMPD